LNVWGLVEFEKVVYLDADCLVVSNLDHMFDMDTSFAAAPDVFPPDKVRCLVLLYVCTLHLSYMK
jgi:glycogenin glucosyltransferase